MSSTNEEAASQMSVGPHSDASSVCPGSPNPSSPRRNHQPQPSAHATDSLQAASIAQPTHQHQYQDSFNYATGNADHGTSALTEPASSNYIYDYRTRPSTSQQQPVSLVQTPSKRNTYTGVDKLLVAAMLEESAARSLAFANSNRQQCIPSGRGIGYYDPTGLSSNYSQIPTPSNRCELELYNLLDKANLLNYFGTFLSFGGDDVQQLIDADEEEFLEIMSLVGMTKKPLHVRRLQKVLVEFAERKERQKEDAYSISMCRRAL